MSKLSFDRLKDGAKWKLFLPIFLLMFSVSSFSSTREASKEGGSNNTTIQNIFEAVQFFEFHRKDSRTSLNELLNFLNTSIDANDEVLSLIYNERTLFDTVDTLGTAHGDLRSGPSVRTRNLERFENIYEIYKFLTYKGVDLSKQKHASILIDLAYFFNDTEFLDYIINEYGNMATALEASNTVHGYFDYLELIYTSRDIEKANFMLSKGYPIMSNRSQSLYISISSLAGYGEKYFYEGYDASKDLPPNKVIEILNTLEKKGFDFKEIDSSVFNIRSYPHPAMVEYLLSKGVDCTGFLKKLRHLTLGSRANGVERKNFRKYEQRLITAAKKYKCH